MNHLFRSLLLAASFAVPSVAQDLPIEADYYPITTFETPKDVVLEASGFQMMPNGKLAVCSRRGEIWMVNDPFSKSVSASQFQRFAHGLHETLTLDQRDGWLYTTQRSDVTRMRDTDDDGVADDFEVVNGDWGISGDYHEYAFGSKFDKNGDTWVVLCLTGSFSSKVPFRGWCVRVTPDGKMIPTCSGVRSPGGIAANDQGDMFYTDNQGPWNGTCSLKHLVPGKSMGHPGGFEWYKLAESAMGKKPDEPNSGSRIMTEAKRLPSYEPPAILFPYNKMGKSAAGVACDTTDGEFGPFRKQMFVTDQSYSTVMRCYLEQVDGHYQGACFPFLEGFDSGSLALEITPNGKMFVGGTNRGWGSRGRRPFAVERVDWTGKMPFEVHEMRAKPDGFELTFTQSVDQESVTNLESYKLSTYTYIYQESYGSPEVDHTTPTITKAVAGADGKSVRLFVDGLQVGHVHELHSDGVRSSEGAPLLHKEAYYTLNYIPTK
ncbi:hypothetical protein [Planctomycetes bacterium K23_9]